jgi:hypothetical protein
MKDDSPMSTLTDDHVLTIVTQIAEQNGCRLVDIDLENRIVNLEGPEEDQLRCAAALERVLR